MKVIEGNLLHTCRSVYMYSDRGRVICVQMIQIRNGYYL